MWYSGIITGGAWGIIYGAGDLNQGWPLARPLSYVLWLWPLPKLLPCSGDWQLHHSVRRQCRKLRRWHLPGWWWWGQQRWIQHQHGLRYNQRRVHVWRHLHPEEDHHSLDIQSEILAALLGKPGPLQTPPMLPAVPPQTLAQGSVFAPDPFRWSSRRLLFTQDSLLLRGMGREAKTPA